MSVPKLVGAAAVVLLLVAWSVRSFVVDDESVAAPPAAAVAASNGATQDDAGASDVVSAAVGEWRGFPVGYPPTVDGATTSAVNWVASLPTLIQLNPLSLQNSLSELMTTDGSTAKIDEAVND